MPDLEQLLDQLERRKGDSQLVIHHPRQRDWQATIFRDHPRSDEVIYCSGHGDTLADALRDLLADPMVTA